MDRQIISESLEHGCAELAAGDAESTKQKQVSEAHQRALPVLPGVALVILETKVRIIGSSLNSYESES